MRLTSIVRGGHFGNLGVYVRGVVSYRISPFEQRAYAGFIASIPKTLRRIMSNVLYIAPPMLGGYLIFAETEKEYHRLCRKNPADYANDK